MDSLNEDKVENKVYPTVADADGFCFETAEDEESGIYTKIYPNGNITKRCLLPRSRKIALVRDLSAQDTENIARYIGKDGRRYQMALITVATTFDGEKMAIEDIANLRLMDYSILTLMNRGINF